MALFANNTCIATASIPVRRWQCSCTFLPVGAGWGLEMDIDQVFLAPQADSHRGRRPARQ